MAGYYNLNIPEIAQQRRGTDKQPFPHQKEAFSALSKTLTTPITGYKGTLLVLPTGGGKTFTSVNWVCRNILSKGIKVLWLAQSSYLIDQAADTFIKEIHNAIGRDTINLRVVSSSTNHANSGSIDPTDDVLICTTQTAVSAYNAEKLDGQGQLARTPFRRFVDSCKDNQLFVVVDEAHHTPAYGCRTLLLSMRENIRNLYILGLTATPMHMDKRISGWLKNIYDQWICYSADKVALQANKVLSVPKYIEKQTGFEFSVDDSLFERLVHKHKDLPEHIIENLAGNRSRNNYIISDYVNSQSEYGKTLIFADRWYQCEYLADKLNAQGIRAGAVYSVVAGQDAVYRGGSGRRNDEMNRQTMQDFRDGKLDVLVNVKMLTEGIDVPDVKTVMITRQTTSNILLAQMVGRALRGEKAGGGQEKDYANVVFFYDSWKRLLPWAVVDGETGEDRPVMQRRNPMSIISISLIKLATADIEYEGFENAPFLTFVPTGFLGCEFTVAIEDGDIQELITYAENAVVYEFNRNKYEALIAYLSQQDLTAYASENLAEAVLEEQAQELAERFFGLVTDDFDGMLIANVSAILRHMAQNNQSPAFVDFHQRDLYDMDKLALQLLNTSPLDADILLSNHFNDVGLLWSFFYKTYDSFLDAYYKSQKRVLTQKRGQMKEPIITPVETQGVELTDEMKRQVFIRDNFTCLCCGKAQRKGVSLNADHIQPVAMGGSNAISNLQTLCKQCNAVKHTHQVDFRVTKSPLRQPKAELSFYDCAGSDSVENALTRIINDFYHCGAVCNLKWHERRNGQYYSSWRLMLYAGNEISWLEPHIGELLAYVQGEWGYEHVQEFRIVN